MRYSSSAILTITTLLICSSQTAHGFLIGGSIPPSTITQAKIRAEWKPLVVLEPPSQTEDIHDETLLATTTRTTTTTPSADGKRSTTKTFPQWKPPSSVPLNTPTTDDVQRKDQGTTTIRRGSTIPQWKPPVVVPDTPTIDPIARASTTQKRSYAAPFPPRSGHVAFQHDDRIFLFGGYAEEEEEQKQGDDDDTTKMNRSATNDMWEGRLMDNGSSYEWNIVDQKGDIPEERLVSASVELNERSYLFGGWNPQTEGTGGVILDTIHSFDPSTHTWTELETKIPDGPTSRHVALSLPCQTKALIHNHRCDGFVYVFDSKDETMVKQPTSGIGPSSRGLHTACMLGSFACVFGGAAQDGTMSNEAFLLNTITWEWKKVELDNGLLNGGRCDVPVGRAGSTMVTLNETCAILFGGACPSEKGGLKALGDVWALNVDRFGGSGRWEQLFDPTTMTDSKECPPARNAATLSPIVSTTTSVDSKTKSFLLQGGWAPFQKTWSDSFVLDIKTR
jgi:hypothetical protein